jgi:hypothetical protein
LDTSIIIRAMSEYIELDAEIDDDGTIHILTNLPLVSDSPEEYYASVHELEFGSPLAQALAGIEGIETLKMEGTDLIVTCRPESDRHVLIADISAALKEFFL